jgi:hypothetical protein
MPPYFHSGVVMAPWGLGLGARWRRHLEQIAPLFAGPEPLEDWGGGGEGDEHALATAIEGLRQEGATVVPIPWAFHTRPLLLRARVLLWTDVAVFHYHRALKPYAGSVADLLSLFHRGSTGGEAKSRIAARDLAAYGEFYAFLQKLLPEIMRCAHG